MARKEYYKYKDVFYIYTHTRLDTMEVFYVGKGTKDRAWSVSGRNAYWTSVANKCGYSIEVVDVFDNEDDAFNAEVRLIAEIGKGNLCNMTDGGEGVSGVVVSPETREKLSEARRGNTNAKGKKWSEESRERQSIALKGKKRSPETRARMSEAMYLRWAEGKGPVIPDESRRRGADKIKGRPRDCGDKISIATRGGNHRLYDPTRRRFCHEDYGVVECTKIELRDMFGIPLSDIAAVVSGRQKTCRGWRILE